MQRSESLAVRGVKARAQVPHNTKEAHESASNEEYKPVPNIFAMGDCCANVETPLPALAQASAHP